MDGSAAMPFVTAAGCVLALAAADLFCWVPMLLKLLTKKSAWMHSEVTSDIPGNPHAFDDSIISLFRTLPELNNFNIVWTSLPLSEPLVLTGVLPPARINSLSIYAPDSVPNSIDLANATKGPGGELEIRIENSSKECESDFLSTRDFSRGFLVMRNYLVPPGTRVVTPVLKRASDGTVVREAQVLAAGPPSTARSLLALLAVKGKKLLVANSVFLLACKYWLHAKARASVIMLLAAGCLAVICYRLLYLAGKGSLKKMSDEFCKRPNELVKVALEKGSKVSQPSTMHTYWMMQLDIPLDSALHIKGKIKDSNQKYWSLTVYDDCGMPLPQFVFDQNVRRSPLTDDAYSYDVCITLDPNQAVLGTGDGVTVVDISRRPEMRRGYVLFRLVHPSQPSGPVEAFSAPAVSVRHIYGDVREADDSKKSK